MNQKHIDNMLKNIQKYENINDKNQLDFLRAIFMSDLVEAKKIYEKHSININFGENVAFRYSCEVKDVEITKWIYEEAKKSIPINIHDACGKGYHPNTEFYDCPFLSCFDYDCFEKAKWLYNLSLEINSPINISNYLTFYSCISKASHYGYLDMLKWIVELYEKENGLDNIQLNDLYRGFWYALQNNFIDTAKFIYDLAKRIQENNDILNSYNDSYCMFFIGGMTLATLKWVFDLYIESGNIQQNKLNLCIYGFYNCCHYNNVECGKFIYDFLNSHDVKLDNNVFITGLERSYTNNSIEMINYIESILIERNIQIDDSTIEYFKQLGRNRAEFILELNNTHMHDQFRNDEISITS